MDAWCGVVVLWELTSSCYSHERHDTEKNDKLYTWLFNMDWPFYFFCVNFDFVERGSFREYKNFFLRSVPIKSKELYNTLPFSLRKADKEDYGRKQAFFVKNVSWWMYEISRIQNTKKTEKNIFLRSIIPF